MANKRRQVYSANFGHEKLKAVDGAFWQSMTGVNRDGEDEDGEVEDGGGEDGEEEDGEEEDGGGEDGEEEGEEEEIRVKIYGIFS